MLAAQNRHKSYANLKNHPMVFRVGGQVFLKVLPWRGLIQFGKTRKLNMRYIERVGTNWEASLSVGAFTGVRGDAQCIPCGLPKEMAW